MQVLRQTRGTDRIGADTGSFAMTHESAICAIANSSTRRTTSLFASVAKRFNILLGPSALANALTYMSK